MELESLNILLFRLPFRYSLNPNNLIIPLNDGLSDPELYAIIKI